MSNFEKELEKNTKETAKVLGISKKDALALEFIAMEAFASMVKHRKGEALFHVAAKHAIGEIDGKTKDQYFSAIPA